MKEVLLGDIDVDPIVPLLDIFSDELLDGMDFVVNEELLPWTFRVKPRTR